MKSKLLFKFRDLLGVQMAHFDAGEHSSNPLEFPADLVSGRFFLTSVKEPAV